MTLLPYNCKLIQSTAMKFNFSQEEKNTEYDSEERVAKPGTMFLVMVAFVFAGIAAPIVIGQSLARILTSIGITSYITIWLVPGAPIFVVYLFWNICKRIGIRI